MGSFLTMCLDNQGMFGQILAMPSFANTVHPDSITNTTIRGFLTAYATPFYLVSYKVSLLIENISESSNWVLGLVSLSMVLPRIFLDENWQQLAVSSCLLLVSSSKPVPKMQTTSSLGDSLLV
jgi:hypothetical protein